MPNYLFCYYFYRCTNNSLCFSSLVNIVNVYFLDLATVSVDELRRILDLVERSLLGHVADAMICHLWLNLPRAVFFTVQGKQICHMLLQKSKINIAIANMFHLIKSFCDLLNNEKYEHFEPDSGSCTSPLRRSIMIQSCLRSIMTNGFEMCFQGGPKNCKFDM